MIKLLCEDDKKELEQKIEAISSQTGVSSAVLQAIYDNLSVVAFDDSQMTKDQYNANLAIIMAAINGESGDNEDNGNDNSGEGGGDSGGDTHNHSYTSAVTTAATCTTSGVKTYTCSCGDSHTEEIPATGHTYVNGVCSVCGAAEPVERVWLANGTDVSINDTYGNSLGTMSIVNHNTVDITASSQINSKKPILISDRLEGDKIYGSNLVPNSANNLETYKHLSAGDVVAIEMTVNSATLAAFCSAGFILGRQGATSNSDCVAVTQVYGIKTDSVLTASVTLDKDLDLSWFGFYMGQGLSAGDTFNATLSVKVNGEEILG